MGDEGPWTDPAWAKPAKWQIQNQAAEQDIINNENVNPSTIPDAGKDADATPPAPAVDDADEIKPAPAPQ